MVTLAMAALGTSPGCIKDKDERTRTPDGDRRNGDRTDGDTDRDDNNRGADVDFILEIDLDDLHRNFDRATEPVYVQGSFNGWVLDRVFDNGEGADETAGDDVYTYRWSDNLDAGDELASVGDEVQFLFVFSVAGTTGVEYTVDGDAVDDGIRAFSDLDEVGVFREEDVILVADGLGSLNTAIVIGGD